MTSVTDDANNPSPSAENTVPKILAESAAADITDMADGANDQYYGTALGNIKSKAQPVFLALQGGGAKGIVHIGGIAALEELGFDIRAVSGTSAGSMVAALIAAGYTSEELVHPESKKHFFLSELFGKGEGQLNYSKPTHLFTGFGWFSIQGAVYLGKAMRIFRPFRNFRFAEQINHVIDAAIAAALLYTIYKTWPASATWMVLGSIALLPIIGWALVGITSVRKIRNFIDAAIAFKLKGKLKYRKKNITFRDLHDAGCIPLKIIATNKTTETLELFSNSRTPRVAVADAVAASICLPVIFRHWRFKFIRHTPFGTDKIRGKFLDGGLVSNLPAWAFDEERLMLPEATTVAFSLESLAPEEKAHWLLSIANTVVNGSGEIHTRASGSMATVALPTTLTLLDFGVGAERVYDEVATAKAKAVKDVGRELIHAPNALTKGAQDIYEIVRKLLDDTSSAFSDTDSNYRVRVALGVLALIEN